MEQGRLIEDYVGKQVYQRQEVFVVGGQPTVTYNPRPGQGAERRVRDYLDEKNRILCITGPTKSGKTVLVREVVPNALRISGGDLLGVNDFWSDVVDLLGEYTDETGERTMIDTTVSTAGVGAAVKPAGIGVETEANRTTTSGTQQTRAKQRSRDARNVAKAALRKTDRPVVIDDFHHVEPNVQKQIIRGVKDLVFEGVMVILVAVPHRAADIVRAEPEMKHRVEHLRITPWTKQELEDIASQGFDALNIDCPSSLSKEMASESYGSPHLMQDFCLQICKANDLRETLPSRQPLLYQGDRDGFFRFIAEQGGDDETYRKLAQGPRHRTDRKRRQLKDGRITDLYGVVLAAIAQTGPKTEIDWWEIKSALKSVMEDDPPSKREYTNALEHMSKIARELVWEEEHSRFVGDPALEYDSELDKLHISDPFFAFQLRWTIRQ
jgi:hypothetical protein